MSIKASKRWLEDMWKDAKHKTVYLKKAFVNTTWNIHRGKPMHFHEIKTYDFYEIVLDSQIKIKVTVIRKLFMKHCQALQKKKNNKKGRWSRL